MCCDGSIQDGGNVMEETKDEVAGEQPSRRSWIKVMCRFCNRQMFTDKLRATQNKKTGQIYVETTYVCPRCDYWDRLTIPRKLAATIVDESCLPTLESGDEIDRIFAQTATS
jgi:hypothetical protein